MMTTDRARPGEHTAIFHLIFQHLDEKERDARVARALNLLAAGELDPEGILAAREGGELQGALVCTPLRGRSGLLWPPQVREGPRRKLMEDQLVQMACSWLRGKGALLAQAILPAAEMPLAVPLERNGFRHITRLLYLRHDLEGDFPPSPQLRYQTYLTAEHELFHDILFRSYEGTLDCPELTGVRSIEEIIDGHQAQGNFHPERWWLAWKENQPVGVVLATEVPDWPAWDMAYIGVVPGARGQGIGRAMTQLVLHAAQTAGAANLTVAVDVRNRPACNLYQSLGFQRAEEREVFLAFLKPAAER